MGPANLFEAYKLDNIEFLAKPENLNTKFAWNCETNTFCIDDSLPGSDLISDDKYEELLALIKKTFPPSLADKNANIAKKMYENLMQLDQALFQLNSNIDEPQNNLEYFAALDMKQTAAKLQKIMILLPQLYAGFRILSNIIQFDVDHLTFAKLNECKIYAFSQKDFVQDILIKAIHHLSEVSYCPPKNTP